MTQSPTPGFSIGIDIGNTNVKCLALSARADVAILESAPTPRVALRPRGGGTRIDVESAWHTIASLLKTVSTRIAREQRGAAIAGIAVTSAGGSATLLDESDAAVPIEAPGEASDLYRRYRATLTDKEYFATTGYPFEPGTMAFALAALSEQEPEAIARARALVSLADFINFRLTGEVVREESLGGSFGLWDRSIGGFWSELLAALSLPVERLGRTVANGSLIGTLTASAAEATGLPRATRVYAGGHDYLCAALATGCRDESVVLDVLGTYEIIATFRPQPALSIDTGGQRVFIDSHVVPGSHSLMVESLSGARLEWFARELLGAGMAGTLALLRELDAGTPQSPCLNGPLFVPGHPVRDDRDTFLGLSACASTHDLLRAHIEGLCFDTRAAFDFLAGHPIAHPSRIMAVGGGSRSRFWMQTKADILGRAITIPALPEATVAGAALLAGLGAGVYPDIDAAVDTCTALGATTVIPNMRRHELFDDVYTRAFLPVRDYLQHMIPVSLDGDTPREKEEI